jgi:DNA-binding protein YbaB
MRGTAKAAVDTLDHMLNLVYDWEAKADAFIATGSDDDDVIATHDSRGKLIELSIRPGLQQELTTEELEDVVNKAIAENAARAEEGLMAISREFLANFNEIPQMLAQHPVGGRFADALSASLRTDAQTRRA